MTDQPEPTLEENVAHLAHLRAQKALADAELQKLQAILESSHNWQFWRSQADKTNAELARIDEIVRYQAVAAYRQTGEKTVHPAVKIQVRRSFFITDELSVADYCRAHLPAAFVLDRKLVEKHARGVAETAPMPGVMLADTPIATVASDLSAYVMPEVAGAE